MKTIINATVQFGMAAIPVAVASALNTTNDPSFKLLHEPCHQPVSRSGGGGSNGGGYYCHHCDTSADVTVHGFEYAKGEFVWFTDAEMANVKPDREPVIVLKKFVKATSIKPVMVDKHYFLKPSEMAALADPYGQLYSALAKLKVAGVGTQTLWGKEHPCAIVANQDYASGGVLMMLTLMLAEDLVDPDFAAPVPSAALRASAQTAVAGLIDELRPEDDLVSESRDRTKDAITAKVEGREIAVVRPQETLEPVMDIGQALQQEIAARKKASKPKPKARAKA